LHVKYITSKLRQSPITRHKRFLPCSNKIKFETKHIQPLDIICNEMCMQNPFI
jgi:hypothetical protein